MMSITLDGTNGITTPDLAVDTNTLFVDAANNRVGVGTSSPDGIFKAQSGSSPNGANILIGYNGTSENYFDANTQIFRNGAFAERMRIDSSGNVGVGTSSPAQKLVTYAASGNLEILNTVRNENTGAGVAAIGFNVAHSSEGDFTQAGIGLVRGIANGGGALAFYNKSDGATGNFTTANERMRIDNGGRVFVNTTSLIGGDGGYLQVNALNNLAFQFNRNSNDDIGRFYRSGTKVGSISVTASTTAYNTSSDYRLKENVVPLAGAADRLMQIPVCRFNFIADPDKTVDGFLAHEVQAFVPECVTGEKDQVETVDVKDEDGNVIGTEERPVYQGIDQSKLVPLLTAALQEALQKVEALEARITALEVQP